MKNKILAIFLVCMFFMTAHSSIAINLRNPITNKYFSQSDEVHVFNDSIGDVFDEQFDPHPEIKDIDIDYIVYTKKGKNLTLDIFMVDKLVKSPDIELVIIVYLYTTEQEYQILYLYSQLFENISGGTVGGEIIDVEIAGFNTKKITITFNLINETELYQDIIVSTAKADIAQTFAYTDIYPNQEFLDVDAGDNKCGRVGKIISFSCSVSGGTPPYNFEWDFGDGNISEEQNTTHIYNKPGVYDVTIYVLDDEGVEGIDFLTVTIKKRPRIHILLPLKILSKQSQNPISIFSRLIFINYFFKY
jgi:hypothetical protein